MYGPHTPCSALSSCSRPLKITWDVDPNSSTSSMLFSSFIIILLSRNLSPLARIAGSLPEVRQMFLSHSLTLSLLLTFNSLLTHRPLAQVGADSQSHWRSKKASLESYIWSYIRQKVISPAWRQLLMHHQQADRSGESKHRDGITLSCPSCVYGRVVSYSGVFSICDCLCLWNGAYVLSPKSKVWRETHTPNQLNSIWLWFPPYSNHSTIIISAIYCIWCFSHTYFIYIYKLY